MVAFDPEHSGPRELRWWLLGKVGARVMLVGYTHRPGGAVRIIGHKEKSEKPEFEAEGCQVNLQALNGVALPNRGSLKFKPFKHGGVRAGAGRKPAGRTPVLLRLSPGVVAASRAKAKAENRTLSDVAEERLAIA